MKFISLTLIALVFTLSSCSSQLSTEEYLQRASEFVEKEEWKSAIIEYKNSIKQSPQNAEARYLLGKAYLKTFNSAAAIKEFTKSIELGADKNKLVALLGEAYKQQNKNNEIISEITINDSLNQADQLQILALRAGAYMNNSDSKMALRELNEAKIIDSNHKDVRLMWAAYEARFGSIENQLIWLKPLLDLNDADAWSQIGKLERYRSNLDKAEEAFSTAINERKFVNNDYTLRALVRISLKKYDAALEDIKVLRNAGLVSPLLLHSEGVIAFYQNDLDLAQSKFAEVLARYSDYGPSLFVLGLTYFKKDNLESAINSLNQYLKLNPKDNQARLVLARALIRSKNAEQAIVELEHIYKQEPTLAVVSSLLGEAYAQNGRVEEAVKLFEKFARQNPKEAIIQMQLGSVLIRNKSTAKRGQEALLNAIDLNPDLNQANLSLYLSYMQSKEFAKAAEIAKTMIDNKPNDPSSYNLLAHSFLARGQIVKAIKIFDDTYKKFPSDPITAGHIARIKTQSDDVEGAKKVLIKVLDNNPGEMRTLISLSLLESRLGNEEAKINYLLRAIESNPKVLSPKMILATEYLKKKDFKKVVDSLRDISDDDKSKIEVQLINVKAKIGLKEYDFALSLLKKLVVKYPNSASTYFLMGQSYGYLQLKDKMKKSFEKVLSINPDYFAANLILTRLSLLEGNNQEFEYRISKMIKAYPDSTDVKFLHAKMNSRSKDFKAAIIELEELLEGSPSTEIVLDIARNKWASGDKSGAVAGLELWIDHNQQDAKTLMMLGQFYIALNRFEEANKAYSKVDSLLPNNATVLNNMAWLLLDSDPKQGVKLAKKALALEPNSPFIKDTLAMLLFRDNQLTDALLYSKQAIESLPNFVEVHLNYAKILTANNQKVLAKDVLNSIYSKVKSFEQRKTIQTMINKL